MKKLFFLHLLLLILPLFWRGLGGGFVYAQNEKTKEVISNKTDFRIEKATAFIQVLDADLKIPVNANIVITDQTGKQVASFVNQPSAKVHLPINNTYQVQVASDKFKSQTATLNLKKVKDYELSESIYLQPNKKTIKIAVGDDDTDRSNVALVARSKTGTDQVRFTPIEGTNEYQAEIREGENYQLDLKDYAKNYIYTQDISTANAGATIQINPDQVGNLSKTQKYTKRDTPATTKENENNDPTKQLTFIDDNDTPEIEPIIDSAKANTDNKADTPATKEDKAEPKTYGELLGATQEAFLAKEKELLEKQEAIKKRLGQLSDYLEKNDVPPAEKEKLKAYTKNLEDLLDKYDQEYQVLRKQNLEKISEIKSKMGFPIDFFKQYWHILLGMAIAILVLLIALIISAVISRNRAKQRDNLTKLNQAINKQKEIIEEERHKSETLLLNILPQMVAEELKTTGKAQMRSYERVSILFTDFKGFTEVAAKMSPEKLMDELNDCFTGFDEIIANHNMEKIKTIGDAYMCAGGIPQPNSINPVDAVLAGLEMQDFMQRRRKERLLDGEEYWQCRLGINTGEIKAGVIGTSKFAYDIWGDPVNIASRMESGGEVNKVNISEETYLLVKDFFDCSYRGEVEVKNGLTLKMYFIDRIKPELSADKSNIKPNERFEQLKKERFA